MAQDQQAKNTGRTGQNSGGASAGIAAHHRKMAKHMQELKGQGATTGGFATSVGNKPLQPSQGKFYSKGKH